MDKPLHDANPLVIDVGMHRGEDTARYLDQGYDVIAIEANPKLVGEAHKVFAGAIERGRLHILFGAVSRTDDPVTFYVNSHNSEWSSTNLELGGRFKTSYTEIKVPAFNLGTFLARIIQPTHYIKIDIEGDEGIALRQLLVHYAPLPKYISVEANNGEADLEWLKKLGYNRFKIVEQTNLPKGTSGPFGEDAPGDWSDHVPTLFAFLKLRQAQLDDLTNTIYSRWYDFHAKKED